MAKTAAAKKADNVVDFPTTPGNDAVIALALGKMKRAKDEFESANGAYRNVLKHVEAKGLNLSAAKEAISIQKSGKVEEQVAYLTALFEYLTIFGCPLTKQQLELFRVEQPRTPAVDKAREHGRYTGIMGLGMSDNPYAEGSEQGQAWIDAWHGGNKERDLVLAMEPADGSDIIRGENEDEDSGSD